MIHFAILHSAPDPTDDEISHIAPTVAGKQFIPVLVVLLSQYFSLIYCLTNTQKMLDHLPISN